MNTTLKAKLEAALEAHLLLNHPFYQDWMKGVLSKETLQNYTVQYYPHVSAFPRFVSAIHSRCENEASRKALFQNLSEEEGAEGRDDHPELWLQFAEGLGVKRSRVKEAPKGTEALRLVDTFFELCHASYAEGLGALMAYESQVPAIAEAKIHGLKSFYGIEDERTLRFFEVHRTADQLHSETCLELVGKLPEDEQEKAFAASQRAAGALWDFLTEVNPTEYKESQIA
jgi:pyrroloquinoline-quinone synthase